jgi:hypothetical protein
VLTAGTATRDRAELAAALRGDARLLEELRWARS